jgi:two-component system NarL family sensor kinase
MKLRQKILLLAVAPLTLAMLAIMLTVRHQSIALAQHERQLVESAYLQAKETELRAYVKLAQSAIAPLLASGRNDQATRDEAMRTLARLDFGPDGYFFLYDLHGRNLMHPRQPELVGRDLWDLTDARGQPTIQKLVAAAQNGGGFVRYMWDKPSSHQSVRNGAGWSAPACTWTTSSRPCARSTSAHRPTSTRRWPGWWASRRSASCWWPAAAWRST